MTAQLKWKSSNPKKGATGFDMSGDDPEKNLDNPLPCVL